MLISPLYVLSIYYCINTSLGHIADSKSKHTVGGEHNPDYDHQHFLGKEMSHEFDELPMEQVLERLGSLFDKIDTNKDGKLSKEEMTNWMRSISNNYITEDADRYWSEQGVAEGQKLTWAMYEKNFLTDDEESGEKELANKLLKADKKRWLAADVDKDGELSKEELKAFLHPEEFDHTRSTVAEDLLEEIDKDRDGFISEDEYLADMGFKDADPDTKEHRQHESELFHEKRDHDKDGKLNFEEFMDWIVPFPEKYVNEESEHLINEADDDKDGMLSKEEMLKHHNVFSGSQITDYGDVLRSTHDEL